MSTDARIVLTAIDQTRAGIASARAGIDSLGVSARSVTGLLSGLGASLSVAGIAAFAKQAIAGAAALDDMAEATGASVEGLSRIQQVARKTGQDFGLVQDGVLKLTRSLSPFSDTSKSAATAIKAIGLSVDDLRRQAPDQAFEILARALNQFEDDAGKSQVAMALLGKTGAQYLPLLKELAADQATVAAVTAQQAAEAEKLEKSWAALTTTAINFGNAIALKIVPALNQLASAMKAGGFGGGLAAGVTAMFSDNLGANIGTLQGKLEGIQKKRASNSVFSGGLAGGALGIEESQIINTIAALKALQREQAIALGEGAYGNEGRGVDTQRKKQIDAVGIAAEETTKKVHAAKKATDDYVGDVFGAATNDVGRQFAKREEQLDQFGFAGSDAYMRMLKDNLAFERDAWGDLARGRADDERDRARAAKEASEEVARDWKRTSDTIENSLTDALMRGFEGGSDIAKTFADTLKNLFASLVLRPIIQPIAQAASSAVLGAIGMGASGSASASGLGGAGNLLSGLGSAVSGGAGMAYLGSAIGGSFGAGLAFGSTGVSGAVAGLGAMASTGSVAGTMGAALGVVGAAAPYLAAAYAAYTLLAQDDGPAQRNSRYQAQLGQNWPHAYQDNQWFSSSMHPELGAFSAQQAAAEAAFMANRGLSAEQIASVNASLSGVSGRRYDFGEEFGPVPQSTFAQISADRMQAIADALGMTVDGVALEISGLGKTLREGLGAAIEDVTSTATQAQREMAAMDKTIASLTSAAAGAGTLQERLQIEDQLQIAIRQRYELEKTQLTAVRELIGSAAAAVADLRGQLAGDLARLGNGGADALRNPAALLAALTSATSSLNLPGLGGVSGAQGSLSASQGALAIEQARVSAYNASRQTTTTSGWQDFTFEQAFQALQSGGQLSRELSFAEKFNRRLSSPISGYTTTSVTAPEQRVAQSYFAAVASATTALGAAQEKYATDITKYAGDVTKATDTLKGLREETIAWYESQKALAESMLGIAAQLRSTARELQIGNMAPVASYTAQRSDFGALWARLQGMPATSADYMAGLEQMQGAARPLLDSARATYASGSGYQTALSYVLSALNAGATRLEGAAPKDYQTQTVGLLTSIDTALGSMESVLASADQRVVEAINSSRDKTVSLLTQIRDRLDQSLARA